ncbi:SDR family oxidoreductase [Aliiroseovarius sp. Z3]|uniref:SDR family oxidoreductase n=1 Tax=Aliiroseovarius sp. Z3 TaxID=2811402 RepID=UPI0023B2EF04|nr:SDR family oxidoreductase [Aliiroseovarius sp. Z3]MDE9451154.1 SDR family oxidoreductase [Aliiroseovarius sp. Z3]
MTRVLVLGGYGLIGAEVMRHLLAEGFAVTGLGRSAVAVRKAFPDADWILRDLSHLCDARHWGELLTGVDAVVNCAGALQDGPRDHLQAVHVDAVAALATAAAARGVQIVQISAAGVSPEASTAFFRTKAAGDQALLDSGAPVVILRPGLVLAPQSYGGTALIRQLAAFPIIQPMAMKHAPIQTVSVKDVALAVQHALDGRLPDRSVLDLVEPTPHSLSEVVAAHRKWLGVAPARAIISAPRWGVRAIAWGADTLGRLGWRSPLRSTAIDVLKDGVHGDPAPYRALVGDVSPLQDTLAGFPAAGADLLKARLAWFVPLGVAVLSLFWLLSGIIGVVSLGAASEVLTSAGWPGWMAKNAVLFWALIDLALGFAILYRPWVQKALLGMLVTCGIYLVSASIVTPGLWLDPLGPLVKILPIMLCIGLMSPLLEDR